MKPVKVIKTSTRGNISYYLNSASKNRSTCETVEVEVPRGIKLELDGKTSANDSEYFQISKDFIKFFAPS